MRLYEYLIGGKKTGRIEDLKDAIPGNKPFCELKEGETFFISQFNPDGTRVYTAEIKITSILLQLTHWVFTGFAKIRFTSTSKGAKYEHSVRMEDLNKTLYVENQRACYKVCSTFKMDTEPLFELVKKEIKNSKK